MVDKIVYTYKFTTLPNIDELRDECKIWLTTILDKFDPSKGSKAFSYFSVITKNWFIHKVKKHTLQRQKEIQYDDIPRSIEERYLSTKNPYEEALGYKQLLEKFNYTQEELASNLGKSRVYITNLTRLLNLPDSVLKFLKDGKLTAGHARALIGIDKALEIAKSIVKNELSVRETERLVKEFSKKNLKSKSTLKPKDEDTEMLESELSAELGFPVSISHNEGEKRGRLVLNYRNLEDLDRVINIILKKTSD